MESIEKGRVRNKSCSLKWKLAQRIASRSYLQWDAQNTVAITVDPPQVDDDQAACKDVKGGKHEPTKTHIDKVVLAEERC